MDLFQASLSVHYPPENYTTPPFPALYWPPQDARPGGSLYYLADIWRFTLLWTVLIYAICHLGAAGIAMAMQLGKDRSRWKYLPIIPLTYTIVAGVEALFAGSVVGLIVGAVYTSGSFWMSTWIPFIWGWVNVLVLIISSFSIQGGL